MARANQDQQIPRPGLSLRQADQHRVSKRAQNRHRNGRVVTDQSEWSRIGGHRGRRLLYGEDYLGHAQVCS
jgi:hypothetical protein